MPLTIEYPLLRSLVIKTAFTESGASRVILNENGGCTKIVISDPQYSLAGTHLRLDIRVSVQAGHLLGDSCIMPLQWEGYLSFLQIPRVYEHTWRMVFQTVISSIYDLEFKPVNMADFLWNIIKNPVHHYISGITINLAPPVDSLKEFLIPMFPAESLTQTTEMLNSMKFGDFQVVPEGLRIDILAEVQPKKTMDGEGINKPLDEQQLQQVIASWETWDGFIVQMIGVLASESLTENEKQTLLDVLLELRYRFVQELSDNTMGKDFVRDQFVKTWKKLGPVYKNHLGKNPSDNILGYLAFFTASDALVSLDRIGSSLGIEISRDGLLRLLHMLNPQFTTITYDSEINQPLRKALGMEEKPSFFIDPPVEIEQQVIEIPMEPEDFLPENDASVQDNVQQTTPEQTIPLPFVSPEPSVEFEPEQKKSREMQPTVEQEELIEEIYLEPETPQKSTLLNQDNKSLGMFLDFFVTSVGAAELTITPQLKDLRKWVVKRDNIQLYLESVKNILNESTLNILLKDSQRQEKTQFYKNLVISTAWQESCLRQFQVKQDKLTYLRSYNGSSVGLMQINERVWRSLYDLNQLRWNIAYNAQAGTEILDLYLKKYVFNKKKKGTPITDKTLAGIVYAMYNGGPAQYDKYLNRVKNKSFYESDTLYMEKYLWVQENRWDKIDRCLTGK
jgi:hypothetical protein